MNIQKNWATFYFVSKLEIVENLPQVTIMMMIKIKYYFT